jgi:hypothetical protein
MEKKFNLNLSKCKTEKSDQSGPMVLNVDINSVSCAGCQMSLLGSLCFKEVSLNSCDKTIAKLGSNLSTTNLLFHKIDAKNMIDAT